MRLRTIWAWLVVVLAVFVTLTQAKLGEASEADWIASHSVSKVAINHVVEPANMDNISYPFPVYHQRTIDCLDGKPVTDYFANRLYYSEARREMEGKCDRVNVHGNRKNVKTNKHFKSMSVVKEDTSVYACKSLKDLWYNDRYTCNTAEFDYALATIDSTCGMDSPGEVTITFTNVEKRPGIVIDEGAVVSRHVFGRQREVPLTNEEKVDVTADKYKFCYSLQEDN